MFKRLLLNKLLKGKPFLLDLALFEITQSYRSQNNVRDVLPGLAVKIKT